MSASTMHHIASVSSHECRIVTRANKRKHACVLLIADKRSRDALPDRLTTTRGSMMIAFSKLQSQPKL